MTRRIRLIATALLALGLGGCHHMHGHGGRNADPQMPKVAVMDGKIMIDQEVLEFPAGQGQVTITWTLPPNDKLRFARDGIVFDERATGEIVNCHGNDKNPREFTCVNRHTRKGYYKYDINVELDGQRISRDPFVMNY